ncbi:fam-m protein [Plasmodium malariae]|uniref:Fam-m protein n=1 Tax=Plasmodium malariae TaxID=5858 RepID=A0A1D3JLY2_PLAMA|nr:fam-m protein [Plasmodium malariae]SBT87569.1 fam-m protein [Plasmodium malariae]
MELKNKQILLFRIAFFLVVSWICLCNNDLSIFNYYLGENYNICKKIYARNSRILGNYKKNKDSNIIVLKEDVQNNEEYEKKDVHNKEKTKNSYRFSLNKERYYTEIMDYNSSMFDGKYFHFEKKWIKKKDYDNFVERNGRICDIALKKRKFRSYGFGIVLFFLFFLVGIGLPILRVFDFVEDSNFTPFKTLWKFIYEDTGLKSIIEGTDSQAVAGEVAGVQYFYLVTFVALIIILAILLIVAIPKILRNNEKYKKIKYISE